MPQPENGLYNVSCTHKHVDLMAVGVVKTQKLYIEQKQIKALL